MSEPPAQDPASTDAPPSPAPLPPDPPPPDPPPPLDPPPPPPPPVDPVLGGDPDDRGRLLRSELDDPHRLLGPHPGRRDGQHGVVVRLYHPDAERAEILVDGREVEAERAVGGLFAAWLPGATLEAGRPLDYRVVFHFPGGGRWERDDPYRFAPTVGELDLYLFGEGTHRRLWRALGARAVEHGGVAGYAFAVWAANALRVSLVSDLGRWDPRIFPMRRLGHSGVFELFVPGFPDGGLYKFGIVGRDGVERYKADPLASWAEVPPATASRAFRSRHAWSDDTWMAARRRRDVRREPLATYEVHLGSWRRGEDGRVLGYREAAERLVAHLQKIGFDSIELMPVTEHPFDGSWGYQTTGYFAATSRYGDPDDFRAFVDTCHRHGVSVILDWVPGHFVKDEHGLGRFDGTGLYEHADPRQGEHPDWGTYVFNLGRLEVRSFLVSNALFWLDEMHVDGLRVDAVASMLYLDYSRQPGEWVPNKNGGRENLDAIDFLRGVNRAIQEDCPGAFTIAEESTSWPGVTQPVETGGLGFQLKWNMGWMHDTLGYFGVDPFFRPGCHDRLTFAMVYEHSERFVNPLSHDEVVHGKRSLYGKMPGDPWQRLANLRLLFTYQMTRPGKKLLFMGSELAPTREWSETAELDWYLLEDPGRAGLLRFLGELGRLYHRSPCLWRSDPDRDGFRWVACEDRARSILAFERRLPPPGRRRSGAPAEREAGAHLVVVLNLTPVPHERYRIGAPQAGRYRVVLSSDDLLFGGSGFPIRRTVSTQARPADGRRQSLVLSLPPLAALVLEPDDGKTA